MAEDDKLKPREAKERMDEVLRQMLATPPDPHVKKKAAPKRRKRARRA